MDDEEYPIKAPTLEDLRDKTDYAVRQYGPDARWVVNMDGGIYILDNRGETVMLIEP